MRAEGASRMNRWEQHRVFSLLRNCTMHLDRTSLLFPIWSRMLIFCYRTYLMSWGKLFWVVIWREAPICGCAPKVQLEIMSLTCGFARWSGVIACSHIGERCHWHIGERCHWHAWCLSNLWESKSERNVSCHQLRVETGETSDMEWNSCMNMKNKGGYVVTPQHLKLDKHGKQDRIYTLIHNMVCHTTQLHLAACNQDGTPEHAFRGKLQHEMLPN